MNHCQSLIIPGKLEKECTGMLKDIIIINNSLFPLISGPVSETLWRWNVTI